MRDRLLSVAVYDLVPAGIPSRTAKLVTASLQDEIRKLVGVSVIGLDDVRAMLEHEANKQLTGCSQESCLGDVADALGVDAIVVGTVSDVDGQTAFDVKRIAQAEAKVTASFSRRLEQHDGEELLAAVGPAVEELFPDRPLLPGKQRGVDPEIALRLNPPPLPPWSFFTVAGGAGALLLGGAALSAVAAASASQAQGALVRSTTQTVDGKEVMGPYQTAVASTIAADVCYGAGIVAAATAGVVALFVDWRGYADANP